MALYIALPCWEDFLREPCKVFLRIYIKLSAIFASPGIINNVIAIYHVDCFAPYLLRLTLVNICYIRITFEKSHILSLTVAKVRILIVIKHNSVVLGI